VERSSARVSLVRYSLDEVSTIERAKRSHNPLLFQLDAHLDELNTDEHSVVNLPTFDDTTQHDHDTWSAHIMDLTTVPFVRRYEHYNAGSFTVNQYPTAELKARTASMKVKLENNTAEEDNAAAASSDESEPENKVVILLVDSDDER
jgi:hypothetical protein